MLIKVLRYSLRHNGVIYRAGATADLPDSLARRLVARDPKTYAYADPVPTVELVEKTAAVPAKTETEPDFDSMTVAKLKAYAAEKGVKLPHKATRAVILAILRDEPAETLPTVDLTGLIK